MTDVAEQFSTGQWEFTPDVVKVFDQHVRSSVPHYEVVQELVAAAADWLLPAGGTYADLGASTGTTAGLILQRHATRQPTIYLYDEQPDMLAQARHRLGDQATYIDARIQDGPLAHSNADLTTALFTLQFLRYSERVKALRLARTAAADTGALLVAEKVRPADSRWAEIANDLSHDWKADHGISSEAIRAKARALRGVLRPTSPTGLAYAITTSGWQPPETIFRWHNWVLVGAFASPPDTGT